LRHVWYKRGTDICVERRFPNRFVRGPHERLFNSRRAGFLSYCDCFGGCCILPRQAMNNRNFTNSSSLAKRLRGDGWKVFAVWVWPRAVVWRIYIRKNILSNKIPHPKHIGSHDFKLSLYSLVEKIFQFLLRAFWSPKKLMQNLQMKWWVFVTSIKYFCACSGVRLYITGLIQIWYRWNHLWNIESYFFRNLWIVWKNF